MPKTRSETSDYGDFKKITEIFLVGYNQCNLFFNRCDRESSVHFQTQSSLFNSFIFIIICYLTVEGVEGNPEIII